MTESIPLVDLQAQYAAIHSEVDGAIRRVVESAQFIMGPDVAAFEADYAAWCDVPHCVGVGSGTAALELALRALGVGAGDEVVTVAHTFIATAEAISAVGAKPAFVDIDPLTYTLDSDAFAAAITPRTRAVIPVHLYGQPADMTRIEAIAEQHGIATVEDAAQAHGATWAGTTVGAFGDAACFSFYPGKNLGAYGDAGAVTTRHEAVAAQVRLLRNHGRRSKYLHDQVGFGHRMDTLQAAILRAKLPHLAGWTTARRRLAARYTALLENSGVVLPYVAPAADPVWHLYVIRTPERDGMIAELARQGIGAGVHYPVPLHLQPAYADLGYQAGSLPVTETVAATCVSLPLYPEMTDGQQDRVVAAVRQFVEARDPV
ncbi:MAG: DegT/DnrJ/EryC1/StrS family aminotransferase [Caldilineaceae bacterium]|nr:DegT/DnrJ/EryC1/StrS family aminotransferase [Caldilineaceae bacterium]